MYFLFPVNVQDNSQKIGVTRKVASRHTPATQTQTRPLRQLQPQPPGPPGSSNHSHGSETRRCNQRNSPTLSAAEQRGE
ncbi:hypothetical protein JOB18_042766 [Solea senegalensis]|uniref:Uncharacterized protein n=1 Tax=Solea senegalensis TaxID=28829 RepID=A0AAV6QX97_SOLSE|nr:hypothetical protein JOB18_042766 [Solea senegalensis]